MDGEGLRLAGQGERVPQPGPVEEGVLGQGAGHQMHTLSGVPASRMLLCETRSMPRGVWDWERGGQTESFSFNPAKSPWQAPLLRVPLSHWCLGTEPQRARHACARLVEWVCSWRCAGGFWK